MYPELSQLLSLAPAQSAGGGCGGGEQFLLPVLMFAIIYLVLIRPQAQEQKKQQAMLEKLKRGDEVITKSGFIGKVADVEANEITLELAPKVKARVLKSSVAGRYAPKAAEGKTAAEPVKKKS
ncbi:MAG: preprotein translocase subunit YajC [Myxococcota bacterium]